MFAGGFFYRKYQRRKLVYIDKLLLENGEHMKSNIDIFDFSLTEDEMQEIASLDKNERFYTSSIRCFVSGLFLTNLVGRGRSL